MPISISCGTGEGGVGGNTRQHHELFGETNVCTYGGGGGGCSSNAVQTGGWGLR